MPEGDFTTTLVTTRATYTMTPRMSASALIQYNSTAVGRQQQHSLPVGVHAGKRPLRRPHRQPRHGADRIPGTQEPRLPREVHAPVPILSAHDADYGDEPRRQAGDPGRSRRAVDHGGAGRLHSGRATSSISPAFDSLPLPMLLLALAASVLAFSMLRPRAAGPDDAPDVVLFAVVVAAVAAWLAWLARPYLLPLSTGPDLTHHLILIRYIEEHWRLVHDPSVERFLGEMAQYTPGSHILAALAGAWSGTDGLRALHMVQALAVALESGFLVLICRAAAAAGCSACAGACQRRCSCSPRRATFSAGSPSTGFVAQVVAQLFVVAMWWATTAWDDAPRRAARRWRSAFSVPRPSCLAGLHRSTRARVLSRGRVRGATIRRGTRAPPGGRFRAGGAVCAGVYLVGRLGWLQLAGTGGAAPWPSVQSYGWPLVVAVGVAGAGLRDAQRRGRTTAVFLFSVVAQAAAFYLLAVRSGAPQPYMALKMFYLLLWPMAACATMAIGEVWIRDRTAHSAGSREWSAAAVALLIVCSSSYRGRWSAQPALLHPLPPAVSLPLYEAGNVGARQRAAAVHRVPRGRRRDRVLAAPGGARQPADVGSHRRQLDLRAERCRDALADAERAPVRDRRPACAIRAACATNSTSCSSSARPPSSNGAGPHRATPACDRASGPDLARRPV